MIQHPTEAQKIAQGGSEAAGIDILGRARSLHGANWFLPGGEINLPAVLEASNALGELATEVERVRGTVASVRNWFEWWNTYTGLPEQAWGELARLIYPEAVS